MANRTYHPLFETLHFRLCLSLLTLFSCLFSAPLQFTVLVDTFRQLRAISQIGAKLGGRKREAVRGIVAVELRSGVQSLYRNMTLDSSGMIEERGRFDVLLVA